MGARDNRERSSNTFPGWSIASLTSLPVRFPLVLVNRTLIAKNRGIGLSGPTQKVALGQHSNGDDGYQGGEKQLRLH
jgi:hypothetical protein